jgi:hypothetical protein
MFRLAVAVSLLISAVCAVGQNPQSSDPFAVSLAQKSVAALTGGAPVVDVTLKANAISVLGSDGQTGTATLLAKGVSESRVDLSLSAWTRSDIRNASNGVPAGQWIKNGGTPVAYATQNGWTDAAWFFPALSSLTQTVNPSFVFKYIGQEQHSGTNVQHIQVFQLYALDASNLLQTSRMSAMDFYLDGVSLLPVATAFKVHPDRDMNTDIPVEIRFGNYQVVSGIQIPFHTQRMLTGNVILDFTVTSAVVNSGLSDVQFNLQ